MTYDLLLLLGCAEVYENFDCASVQHRIAHVDFVIYAPNTAVAIEIIASSNNSVQRGNEERTRRCLRINQ